MTTSRRTLLQSSAALGAAVIAQNAHAQERNDPKLKVGLIACCGRRTGAEA
jgi:hypothetical protein